MAFGGSGGGPERSSSSRGWPSGGVATDFDATGFLVCACAFGWDWRKPDLGLLCFVGVDGLEEA